MGEGAPCDASAEAERHAKVTLLLRWRNGKNDPLAAGRARSVILNQAEFVRLGERRECRVVCAAESSAVDD
jgi:hypothetical protein